MCVQNTSPVPAHESEQQATIPRRIHFFFFHVFWPYFCKARNKEHHQNNSVCYHQFHLNCMVGGGWFAMLCVPIWGHISRDFCPYGGWGGGRLSCHLASPHTREALGWDYAWKRKGMMVTSQGGHIAAPPFALCIRERGPQFTIRAESDIRWPAGIFDSDLFLCNQNNSYIHRPSINPG